MRKILDKRFSEAVALIIIVSSCLEARSSEEFSFAALFFVVVGACFWTFAEGFSDDRYPT